MAKSPIILSGQTSPGRQIFLPREGMPKWTCTIPTGEGTVCGKPFYADEFEGFLRHAKACARENEQHIHEQSPRKRMPVIYDPNQWDPEYEAHIRKVGRRMEAEGRVVQRPNER